MERSSKTVFISYAREDVQSAERLYKDLEIAGLNPWLDKEAILPGYKWKFAIYQAIKSSRFFIPLFSSNSVEKIGYIQNELKYAIEVSKNFPEKDVYIIPARLDSCNIPFEILEEIQTVDLFPDWDKGINDILKTFREKGIDTKKRLDEQDVLPITKEEKWQIGLSKEDWNNLLISICNKTCIPFIGSGIFSRFKEIIDKWRERYRYPLEDLYNLSRIQTLENPNQLAKLAQFLEIEKSYNEKLTYPKNMLKDMLKEMEPSAFSTQYKDKSPFDILANLDLPIYMTTNYDKFMELALSKSQTKTPQSEFCRWNEELIKYVKTFDIPSVFNKRGYEPTAGKPLVYHILGDIDVPKSMVLTEGEYTQFMIEVNKNEEIIPTTIRKRLPRSSLLFIGYSLEDINFRAIFQGFLNFLSSLSAEERKISVAVQTPPIISNTEQVKMQKYLDQYTRNLFQLNVYWDTPFEFMVELDKRWGAFKKNIDINTCLPSQGI